MDKQEILEYNLSKIALIDESLIKNKEAKNKFVNSYSINFKICNFINYLYKYKVIAILSVFCSLGMYILLKNTLLSILLSLIILALLNLILLTILSKLEPKSNYFEKVEDYNNEKESLLSKRNTYINIYQYILKGDEAILDNIKLKIHNQLSYNYDSNLDKLWLNQDKYALDLVIEMKNKEANLIEKIKNKVNIEINSSERKEGLSLEQLTMIAQSL